jgi:hypothetical protein
VPACVFPNSSFSHTKFCLDNFHKLLPLGAAHNIRLVILNRRDYSTKYTDENLKDLVAGDKSFMERLALEVKHFLLWFIDAHNIPKITADCQSGGFVVMGWSMGNATAFSLLGYPDIVGNESYRRLEPYFRQLILYGVCLEHDNAST